MKKLFIIIIFFNLVFGKGVIGGLIFSKFKKDINNTNAKIVYKKIIHPVQVNDKFVGIYKLISSSGKNYSTPFTFGETELSGSFMTISKNGIITQNIVLDSKLLNYDIGYISNIYNNKIDIFNIPLQIKSSVTYTFSNNIITTNFSSYNLTEKDQWEKIYDVMSSNVNINTLPSGWNLIGTITPIDNLSIFNNAKIIWVYDSNSKSWSAYSSNTETMKAINNAAGINAITSIPANSGIWVFMP